MALLLAMIVAEGDDDEDDSGVSTSNLCLLTRTN